HLTERRIGSVPHTQTGVVLPVALAILYADRLILPEPVEGQQRAGIGLAVFLIAIKTQAAAFIALLIEKEYAWRSSPRQGLPVNHAGVLAFAVGDDHLQFAILFDDVDALDVQLSK